MWSKGKLFLIVEFQLINVKGIIELGGPEKYHYNLYPKDFRINFMKGDKIMFGKMFHFDDKEIHVK